MILRSNRQLWPITYRAVGSRQVQGQWRGYVKKSSNVIDELESRGLIAALTSPNLRKHVSTSKSTIYSGVDPSADSLHVGNLLPLLGLLHFHANGHQAIALIGGATGSIGDPSGKSTERPILSTETLDRNVQGITHQVHQFFECGIEYIQRRRPELEVSPVPGSRTDGRDVQVLNNLDWFKGISFLDFLRDVGKLARVNIMISRDSVKNRLESEQGISFTEFSYQLLQAYDFAHLHKHHGCNIQLGGSDQWGNIVAGIDLIKRQTQSAVLPSLSSQKESAMGQSNEDQSQLAYGITIPLLTTSTGEKFGKSAGNAVWLDEAKTSISDFYQFFLRSTDEDVERYLRIFTFLSTSQIGEIMSEHNRNRRSREAQKILAEEVTELVHGQEGVGRARKVTELLFHTPSRSLKSSEVLAAFKGDSRLQRATWKEIKDVPMSKLLVTHGLSKARGDATRAISAKSLYLNDNIVNDPRMTIHRQNLVDGRLAVLRIGSKNHLILYVED